MQFLLKLMQFVIVVFIVGSNGAWHWAPTGLSAAVVAVLAAFIVTGIISELLRFYRWLIGVPLKGLNKQ